MRMWLLPAVGLGRTLCERGATRRAGPHKVPCMRFMLFMYPGAKPADWQPSVEEVARMGAFNQQLIEAGTLLAADGLHAGDQGARVRLAGGRGTVTDGPFAEAKELVGGYWI